MERTERFYKINSLLTTNRIVTKERFLELLGVSISTFKRDIEYLRDRFYAPIIYNRELCGYSYDTVNNVRVEFPGLWLSSSELKELEVLVKLIKINISSDNIGVTQILERLEISSY